VTSTPESRQLDLIREQFTESAKSFGDYALAGRVAEAEKLADMATRIAAARALTAEVADHVVAEILRVPRHLGVLPEVPARG
jgi:alkylation response protein AidB-like acyl-CoA dehydrogenase